MFKKGDIVCVYNPSDDDAKRYLCRKGKVIGVYESNQYPIEVDFSTNGEFNELAFKPEELKKVSVELLQTE